jgi:hypothetical protein
MCVILCTEINGKQILAKNRDRNYKPIIEIIHEIINGIEVAYIKDKKSGWIEGMNENGFGLVNSTLSILDGKINRTRLSKKKNLIFKALTEKHIGDNFYDIINNPKNNYTLEGHTILFYDNQLIHFENNKKNEFVAEKIKNNNVYSNYGVNLKKEGFTKCNKGMSAFLRANIVKEELKHHKINTIDDLANLMNTNYKNINPRFHPYRSKQYSRKKNRGSPSNFNVSTTGQIVFNMTDLILTYYTDINNSKMVKYINRLPSDYTPKIRIIIKETEKQIKNPKKIFTKKYLNDVEERFDCSKTKKNIYKNFNNKTFKNR